MRDRIVDDRICYNVSPAERGWEVRFDHLDEPQLFKTEQAAVEAAHEAARARWSVFGRASCVKVQGTDGAWNEDGEYGD